MILAFAVPVFGADGNSKKAPVIIQELNGRLEQLGVKDEDVVNIQAEQEFYHVFYRKS